jgi:hypothetical protein
VKAKASLRARDFETAAHYFNVLHNRRPGLTTAMLAVSCRYAPAPLHWADRVRGSALRRFRRSFA